MAAQVHSLRLKPALRRSAAAAPPPPSSSDRVQYPTGVSPGARAVREQIAQVARFNTTVLVLGESGTGKELVARQIHALSERAPAPFVPVNCGAIPAELLESELFGHERGAFTGAISARQGRFEIAQGGTLFLDEIGEMSPHMQVKLLRVLQHKSFERVGSNATRTTDARIIAATHRDLEAEVQAGRFREDLFFRLNVFPIQMPALRDRPQDLRALINLFNTQLEVRGHAPVSIGPSALETLGRYEWPGNVRELENLLERLSVTRPGASVTVAELPERYRGEERAAHAAADEAGGAALDSFQTADLFVAPPTAAAVAADLSTELPRVHLPADGVCLKSVLAEIERQLVQQALTRSDGVVSQAARLLRLGRTTLLEKIRRLNLT
jgi:sigma-54 specific flagellar transcriptional regulator A